MDKFWKWDLKNKAEETAEPERTLYLNGVISDTSWFDDDITPELFKDDLEAGEGDITVWINSPGGDCVAAAQIFNMLKEYKGKVTVKIDGLAASAASVIAMAGDEVLMSPVSTMMIHNPSTIAAGDSAEMKKVTQMLDEVKESIINAYEGKTHLSRRELGKLMDSEYWMNANEAMEKGFADGILYREDLPESEEAVSMGFSPVQVTNSLVEKIAAKCRIEKPVIEEPVNEIEEPAVPEGRSYNALMERLDLMKHHF